MCYNPLIKFKDDFYKVLHLNKKLISFKNYQHLYNYQFDLKNLVASGNVESLFNCRKCLDCLQSKKFDWFLRCKNEILNNWKNIYFITLTFDNDHYQFHNKKRLLSVFFQNVFTKFLGKKNYRYFAVSEYGSISNRFHFHILLYTNYFFDDLTPLHKSKKGKFMQYKSNFLDRYWKYGFHTITKVVNDSALTYCIKYTTKNQKLKVYCSRSFGNFIKDFNNVNLLNIPNSIFINANSRIYSAYKRYLRHEINKEQLYDVWMQNEPYNVLKQEKRKLLTFNKLKNTSNLSYLNLLNSFNTKNLHKLNHKTEI